MPTTLEGEDPDDESGSGDGTDSTNPDDVDFDGDDTTTTEDGDDSNDEESDGQELDGETESECPTADDTGTTAGGSTTTSVGTTTTTAGGSPVDGLPDDPCAPENLPCEFDDALTAADEACVGPTTTLTTVPVTSFEPIEGEGEEGAVAGRSRSSINDRQDEAVPTTLARVSERAETEETVRLVIALLIAVALLIALLTWRYWWYTDPKRGLAPSRGIVPPPAPYRPMDAEGDDRE